MKVTVKLLGHLVQYLPPDTNNRVLDVELADATTVDGPAVHLGIEEVPAVVCINDQETHRVKRLHEGDVVTFFPPLAGG